MLEIRSAFIVNLIINQGFVFCFCNTRSALDWSFLEPGNQFLHCDRKKQGGLSWIREIRLLLLVSVLVLLPHMVSELPQINRIPYITCVFSTHLAHAHTSPHLFYKKINKKNHLNSVLPLTSKGHILPSTGWKIWTRHLTLFLLCSAKLLHPQMQHCSAWTWASGPCEDSRERERHLEIRSKPASF